MDTLILDFQLRSCGVINVCCLRPPGLWHFGKAAQVDYTPPDACLSPGVLHPDVLFTLKSPSLDGDFPGQFISRPSAPRSSVFGKRLLN